MLGGGELQQQGESLALAVSQSVAQAALGEAKVEAERLEKVVKERQQVVTSRNAKVRLIAREAKINLPENCFRHSWITYRIALTGDKAATATEAGNSVGEIDRRYRVPKPKAEGEAWFALRPKPIKYHWVHPGPVPPRRSGQP